MSNANRLFLWLLGGLLLLGVVSYAYWFFTNFESYTEEVKSGISPEARKNHFLAAEYFLRENSQTVSSHARRDIFALTPGRDDTVFIGNHGELFLQRNNEELLQWVKAGGTLILRASEAMFDSDNELLLPQEFDVTLHIEPPGTTSCSDSDNDCEDADTTENTDNTGRKTPAADGNEEDAGKELATFRSDHPGSFSAAFLGHRYLTDNGETASVAIGNEGRRHLLRFAVGSGSVTLLSDTELFTNSDIGKHDHAYLLYQLTRTPGTVWLFYSADMPSLPQLLWQKTPYLLLTGIVLLLLSGWRMLLRSGPQLTPQDASRRNLLEHLDATAEYSWRNDKARQLFDDNRHAIEQAWRRRHPRLNQLARQPRCEWIGEKSDIAASAVEKTLYETIATEQDFIRASAVLQQLASRINHNDAPTPVSSTPEETEPR